MLKHPDLWKAVYHLFPNAPRSAYTLFDPGIGQAEIAAWDAAAMGAPVPGDAALLAAIAAYDVAQTQQASEALALRLTVLGLANSAVGQPISALTAPQVRALLAILLWQAGGIRADGTVRPLAEWVKG